MADPRTVNIGMIVPNTGADVDTWGSVALNPDFIALDGLIGGVQVIGVSNVPVTLTSPASYSPTPGPGPTQSQNKVLRFTGILTANVLVTLPLPGSYVVENLTTGNFVLWLRAVGSGEVIAMEPGVPHTVYNDGTNVRYSDLPPVGSYLDTADASTPSWIFSCTKPPFLICDGSAYNTATYPYLFAKLGQATVPDFRGRAAYYLNGGTARSTAAGTGINCDGRFNAGGTNGLLLTAAQVPSLTSSGNNNIAVDTTAGGGGTFPVTPGGWIASSFSGGSEVVVPFTNGSASISGRNSLSAVNNISVSYTNGGQQVIQSTAPGICSGIRLIRAA